MKQISSPQIPADAVLVDVRDQLDALALPLSSFTALPVILAPLGDLEEGVPVKLPDGAPLVVVCGTGQRSELAGAYLRLDGASNIYLLIGGVRAWRQTLETRDLETRDLETVAVKV